MGRTKTVIMNNGMQIRRAVYDYENIKYMKYKGKIYIVEFDHHVQWMKNSNILVEIYKEAGEAIISLRR